MLYKIGSKEAIGKVLPLLHIVHPPGLSHAIEIGSCLLFVRYSNFFCSHELQSIPGFFFLALSFFAEFFFEVPLRSPRQTFSVVAPQERRPFVHFG